MPPADQVRDAIERVVSSEVFARSERARDLLRYLVEQDLAGHADRLKGFSIAVDVFGKSDTFDPATDTVVRVQAGRLRELLAQYYAREGNLDPVRIAIPRGTYVPDYELISTGDEPSRAEPVAGETTAGSLDTAFVGPDAPGRPVFQRIGIFSAALCLAVLFGAGAAWQVFSHAGTRNGDVATASASAAEAVDETNAGFAVRDLLPNVFLDIQTEQDAASRVDAALRRGLTAFDTVRFIARSPGANGNGMHRHTDFVFIVEEGQLAGDVHLELQNVVSGKVLLSRTLAIQDQSQSAVDDEIADMLTSVASASGVIYASMVETGSETALTHCLSLNEAFYRNQSAKAHGDAYRCLERLATADLKTPLIYSELASLHIQAIVSRYPYPQDPDTGQALDYARAAIQLAPNSPYAHRSMGYVLSRTTTPEEAMRWTRRAHELNTFDLGMAASYGYALILDGAYAEGTPILQRAVSAASAHPTWWDYGLFLGHFMLEDMQAAASAVSALGSSRRAHYVAARLIAADGIGAPRDAEALLTELLASHPNFSADPHAFFRRANYPADMSLRLGEALRAAGLAGAI